MDEVHNLVRPSVEILRNERRMLMLQRLRQLLRTAENSVIIGLSGTPLCDVPVEAAALRGLIKGKAAREAGDEGFVSYYMEAPPSVFPAVVPRGVPRALPPSVLRKVPLRNLPLTADERRRRTASPKITPSSGRSTRSSGPRPLRHPCRCGRTARRPTAARSSWCWAPRREPPPRRCLRACCTRRTARTPRSAVRWAMQAQRATARRAVRRLPPPAQLRICTRLYAR